MHGFLIMDLDYFKEINDTYGHIVGDKVLQSFGKLLRNGFRENDVFGRIGGDEFVVFLNSVSSEENGKTSVERFMQSVQELEIEELEGKHLTISVGMAFSPAHGMSFQELYKSADKALYERKRAGRNGYWIYTE